MIYSELENRNLRTMSKVVTRGSIGAVLTYTSVGIFGYLTFFDKPEEILKQNILVSDYGFKISIIIVRPVLAYDS